MGQGGMTALPISLYIDLERGQKADLEAVARASLAFAATIRDIAFVLDPSVDIRVELASGTESSLSLKPVLRRGKRHWRFAGPDGEFGATMDDTGFVENVLSGNVTLPMVEGLRFTVTLNIYQQFTPEHVWQNVAYAITKVHSFKTPPIQETLDYDRLELPELATDEENASS